MAKENFRPAALRELLKWGAKNWNGKDRIVALGSPWWDRDGYRHFPMLDWYDAKRELILLWCDSMWSNNCRFLAVRK